jgi:hypothetical protein
MIGPRSQLDNSQCEFRMTQDQPEFLEDEIEFAHEVSLKCI